MTGYCGVPTGLVQKIVSRSGCGAGFLSQLKQDIVTRPPVTWFAKEANEKEEAFFQRVTKEAKDASVPMTWRRGGRPLSRS